MNFLKSMSNLYRKHGFTLIELLMAIAILAVLLTFAVPVGRDFIAKNRVATQTEEIVSALHYARHRAALSRKSLTLMPAESGWSAGMFLLENKIVVFQWKWHDADITVKWSGLNENYLVFTPTGINSALAGSFTLCPINLSQVHGRKISMNRIGRIKVEESKEICNT